MSDEFRIRKKVEKMKNNGFQNVNIDVLNLHRGIELRLMRLEIESINDLISKAGSDKLIEMGFTENESKLIDESLMSFIYRDSLVV